MAVQFDSTISRGVTEWLAFPEELEVDPALNGRHDLPDIEWLISSMLEPHGQIQPVSIRKQAGKPLLTSGYSRYRAVAEINRRKLIPEPRKLRCSFTSLTDEQAFIATIHENQVRNETTPMDDAYNIQKLVNVFQKNEAQIASIYRKDTQWVKDRLALIELVPEAQEAVKTGRVKVSAAKAIAKLSKELQKKAVAGEGRVTAASLKGDAPKPSPKQKQSQEGTIPSLREAVQALLEDCDAQKIEGMVYEVHRDLIEAIRAAL